MNFDQLNQAVKFSLVDNSRIRPFVDAHHQGDQSAIPVLADLFDDNEDPRADIIRRHLGQTAHPRQQEYMDKAGGFASNDRVNIHLGKGQRHFLDHPDGHSFVYFQPSWLGKETDKPQDVFAEFIYSRRKEDDAGGERPNAVVYSAMFTPEETRSLADKLPEPHREKLHDLLDRHFGPRE